MSVKIQKSCLNLQPDFQQPGCSSWIDIPKQPSDIYNEDDFIRSVVEKDIPTVNTVPNNQSKFPIHNRSHKRGKENSSTIKHKLNIQILTR